VTQPRFKARLTLYPRGVPYRGILQGDAEEPVRYVEVPRKAANAEEWIASQGPAPASAEAKSDKLN
jgi:hypothetical protein